MRRLDSELTCGQDRPLVFTQGHSVSNRTLFRQEHLHGNRSPLLEVAGWSNFQVVLFLDCMLDRAPLPHEKQNSLSQRQHPYPHGMEGLRACESVSSLSESSMSMKVLSVALDMDKCDFLGISVVSQSRDEGAGVCIGSIAEDGAVAADGRLRSGDVLIRVNEVSLEKASGSLAARVLRDAAQRPGLLSLTLLRFWEPAPDGLFTLPRGEPVRPIDPASWVSHTAAVTGKLLPPYGDDEHLSVDGDMATVVKAMMRSDSGVAVRDRMWLKVLIRDALTGGDAVDWLRRRVAGASERADARRYAAELLERGFIRHAVNARGHKRFSPERYYVVGDLTEMAPMGCRGVGDVFRRGS